MRIINASRGTTLAEQANVARTFWSRFRGLMGCRELPTGCGLVLNRTGSVHTFWMRFPIDVIFVDRNNVVVGLREAMLPNRPFAGAWKATRTLELPAGVIALTGTKRGDQLRFED
ncbi:MAG: DUF192 domain-containing protein [Chloroflexota bacterium]|nr:DUF192 domain-containing protein [Chloroflexota bacterium]PLS77709.1 MAG: hypothetical protein CYG59_22380 [Chloroflexota bacterium]